MNLYFLVEGKTESKVYPNWLRYLLPNFKRVKRYHQVNENNYYLLNARGYPRIIDEILPNAIEEINLIGRYNYLVVCLDADEDTIEERKQEVRHHLKAIEVQLKDVELVLIVQNRCLETWLLGNRKVYKRHPHHPILVKYTQFYDVSINDPELMGKYKGFSEHQGFHKAYFKLLCQERNIRYSEKYPGDVPQHSYLNQLQARVADTKHLATFGEFLDFCDRIYSHRFQKSFSR